MENSDLGVPDRKLVSDGTGPVRGHVVHDHDLTVELRGTRYHGLDDLLKHSFLVMCRYDDGDAHGLSRPSRDIKDYGRDWPPSVFRGEIY